MSREQLQAGKDWVTETFKRLAKESHVQMESLEWGVSERDFDRGMHSLAFIVGNKRHVVKFSDEKLMNCPNDEKRVFGLS